MGLHLTNRLAAQSFLWVRLQQGVDECEAIWTEFLVFKSGLVFTKKLLILVLSHEFVRPLFFK